MSATTASVPGVPVGRHRGWVRVTSFAVPTIWMATAEGLVCLDLIAVERAVNGRRVGKLTEDEAKYAATLLFARGVPYSRIGNLIGVSGAKLRDWFPEQAVPLNPRFVRTGPRQSRRTDPPPCGSRKGYSWHRRHGETPCPLCREANSLADRYYRRHGTYMGAPELVP
ncbi:hypothetical protein [Streptomyces fagopyri]